MKNSEKQQTSNSLPTFINLKQNYPNPFNPGTNIQYSIPKTAKVNLTIYNQLGQKVMTLVNGIRSAGTYTISWNAGELASGLYYYRLTVGERVETKKMLLMQ